MQAKLKWLLVALIPSAVLATHSTAVGVSATGAADAEVQEFISGEVIDWGWNDFGDAPVPGEARSGVSAISAGGAYSLALKGGKVIAWGLNDYEQVQVPRAPSLDPWDLRADLTHNNEQELEK